MNKNNQDYPSFLMKCKWWLIVSVTVLTVVCVVIYLFFITNGILPVGEDLTKSEWLSFIGSYVSSAGTLLIGLIACLQTQYYTERERYCAKEERQKKVQPILSVNIVSVDSSIEGVAEAISHSEAYNISKHENVTIEIENAGEYPICHVMIFDKYLFHLLKSGEKKRIQVAFSDSQDALLWEEHLVVIAEGETERTESGIPGSMNINFEDADGVEWCHAFVLKDFQGIRYYSLYDAFKV